MKRLGISLLIAALVFGTTACEEAWEYTMKATGVITGGSYQIGDGPAFKIDDHDDKKWGITVRKNDRYRVAMTVLGTGTVTCSLVIDPPGTPPDDPVTDDGTKKRGSADCST